MNAREVVVLSGVRTPIGSFGGGLKDMPPTALATHVLRAAVASANIDPGHVEHVCFGQVINTEPRDLYLSRVAAIEAGCGENTPAFNVNRLCGSGLQAVVSAAQSILLGDCTTAVAGGAESMSRAPYLSPALRFGARMGDTAMVDTLLGALHDPFHRIHMGLTAENVARQYGITRKEQDALAVESHRRAALAAAEGRFDSQIVPVMAPGRKGEIAFDRDEHIRTGIGLSDLAGLKPVFAPDGGTVTAGNASGINDGAAALVLMELSSAQVCGARPMARLAAYAHAGVDPRYMGIGPVPAARAALEKAGLSVDDIDVIESNEAFAAQACAVSRELGLDPAKVNPNGSGIALGHPVGATGAIITVKALHELRRIGGRYALVTMCIGGGQGIAAIFERI
ncbi:acetyl-CoA C-acyltransferase family protein [Paracandidimonas soli]|uniref:Acetyl-CoA C-acetyltransferase n=1 Tax=Paracandidimonas soli TaxID=1917182 RepID=A0A4R3VAP0_9BURK|nr:acetyl-CoA C-acyltransferase family protein [Paracandidimonas soli]TCV00652.1 acetyl-CoA C-acetyltransferase [Paracandidimonas soli]